MTAPTNTHDDIDPLADVGRKSVSFKNAVIGYTVAGVVVEAAKMLQGKEFNDKSKPATWPNGDPKMCAVIAIRRDDNGEEEAFWAIKPSDLLSALAAAQTAAGDGRIKVGGHLAVTLIGETPNLRDTTKENIKNYSAVYVPPAAGDPLNGSTTAPAANPAPSAQAPAAAPSVTKPAGPAAPPSGMIEQIQMLIGVGMTNAQIANTPAVAAAGINEATIATIREVTPNAPAGY